MNELSTIKKELFPFDGDWEQAFSHPEKKGIWFIYGKSGSGKSRLSLMLAKYLSQWEKVVFNSLEERFSQSLINALKQINMVDANNRVLFVSESIDEFSKRLAKKHSAGIAIIDSLQHSLMNYKQYLKFKQLHENKLIIFISHADGKNPAGRSATSIMYDADMKIWVEGYKAFAKGRFIGDKAEYVIWPEGAEKYWSKYAN